MYTQSLINKFTYNPKDGSVHFNSTGKRLEPSWDGYVVVQIPEGRKKIKFNKLCFELYREKPLKKEEKILHLNLDEGDTKASNMRLLNCIDYKKVKEALINLEGGIRLQIHPKDSYSYIVLWYEGSAPKAKVIQDVVVAQRFATRLRLKFSKILTQYCIFDA